MKKIFQNRNLLIVSYRLLNDAFFLLLSSFVLIMIAESLIPGIISSHIGMTKFILLLFLATAGIVLLGKKLGITYEKPKLAKNKLLPFIILIAFLLIGNSLMHFKFWENIAITLITFIIFFQLYQLLIAKD